MNTRNNRYTMIRWILTLALLVLPASAMASETPDEVYGEEWNQPENFTDEYEAGDYGRVLAADQGGQIIHENPDPTGPPEETATRNAPVFPGDRVLTSAHQRIEVELAGGSLVRLDDGTELLFQALPNPYAGYRDNIILNLKAGSLQIRTSNLGEDTFRVDTDSASIYLLGDGEFRIDLLSTGETVVRSHRGVAELSGDGGSVLVRSGMQSVAYAGAYPSEPSSYSTVAADRFDRWVRSRDEALRARAGAGGNRNYDDEVVYESLPDEVQPYYRELSGNGSWTYADEYGWVWYPSEVEAGWRPYLAGHWSYGPRGYFWVSNERWGWAPYHYGRWDRVAGYGWCWIPGRVFGGAWVSWSWGSSYVGWAPLNYWNRPVYYGPRYGDYYCGGSWTFIGYNHFRHHNYYNHHVGAGYAYRNGHRGAIVTRPPRVSPRELARDGGSRTRAVRQARDNALNRRSGGARNRDGDTRRQTAGRAAPGTTTARRFRDTENRVRRTGQGGKDNPARTGQYTDRRPARAARGGSGSSAATMPRPTRTGNGSSTMTRTGNAGGERGTPGTKRLPAARPQREKPTYRRAEGDSGDRVRDMYRGVSRQPTKSRRSTGERTGESTDRRPARTATPSRTVRPSETSRPATRRPSTPKARPTPRRNTQPQRKAAPQRSTQPQRKAAPQRNTQPQRKAAPQRNTQPQRKAAPQRNTQPQRKAAPSRSSAPRKSKPSPTKARSSSGSSKSSKSRNAGRKR